MADINLGNDTTINTTLNEPSGINTSVSTDTQLNASVSDINYIPGYEEAEKQRRENEIQRQANELDRIALYEDMEYKKETDYYKGEDGQPGRDGAIQYTAGTGIEITDGNVINNTQTSAEWGNITGTLSDQTDLTNALNSKAESSDIPTKVSDLTNDSGFITNTVNNLTNYYLKTETYNKTEIDTLITQIPGFNVVVVQTLPVSDIDTHTIYLVPKTGSTGDIYDEYLYINNAWELIGNTAVDLSNYYTKTETNTLLNAKQDTLVSGTNIKTINNTSILGTGNITIEDSPEVAVSTTQPTHGEKLWINPDDLPSGSLNPITNQYSVATDKGYSCDYLNNSIVEKSGDRNNGYIKYGNGIMIQWSTIEGTQGTMSTWGNLYYKDISLGNWNTAFTSLYNVEISNMTNQFLCSLNGVSTTSKGSARIVRPDAGFSSATYIIQILAIGTWK